MVALLRFCKLLLLATFTLPVAFSCQNVENINKICASIGYNASVHFPNMFGDINENLTNSKLNTVSYLSVIGTVCSPNMDHFLCASFYPPCAQDQQRLDPCSKFCLEVRDACLYLLTEFGLTWPAIFDCAVYPTSVSSDCVSAPTISTSQPPTNVKASNATIGTPQSHPSGVSRTLAVAWVAVCTLTMVISAVVVILHYIRVRFDEDVAISVIPISISYSLASVSFCVSVVALGDPSTPLARAELTHASVTYKDAPLCIATLCTSYYFLLSAWCWGVVLAVQWFAAGIRPQFVCSTKLKAICHLFGWLTPLPILTVSMALQEFSHDLNIGVCGYNKSGLLVFAIVPLAAGMVLWSLFIVVAHMAHLKYAMQTRINQTTRNRVTETYMLIYVVVQGTVLSLYSYDYAVQPTAFAKQSLDLAKFTLPLVINLTALPWTSVKEACCSCRKTTVTIDFSSCVPPLLPRGDLHIVKETSV